MALWFTKKWSGKEEPAAIANKYETDKSILDMFGFIAFGHENYYKSYISDNMANNLNPKKLLITISQPQLSEKVIEWLYKNNLQTKGWINIKRASDVGVSAFLLFLNDGKMNFQSVGIANREYDVLGNLIKCTIYYDDYNKNNLNLRMYEIYELKENNSVEVSREIYQIDDNGKKIKKLDDYKRHTNNTKLDITQILDIDYIPITIFPNLPSEKSDTSGVEDKIKALDILYEQIILDGILNSTRFIINTNSLVGNVKNQTNKIIQNFIKKNVLILNYDETQNPLPFSTINGQFRGKELTYLYDWNITEINKRVPIHVPAIHKGAQQSRQESSAVNIPANSGIEQRVLLLEENYNDFIRLLLKFDRDLNSNSFSSNEIDNLKINCSLNINLTITKEISNEGDINNGRLKE